MLSAPIGAQAEAVVLDEDALAPAPQTAAPAEASTLPLNALTAMQALDLLGLDAGQWLLVTGAAGLLGAFTLELAALRAQHRGRRRARRRGPGAGPGGG